MFMRLSGDERAMRHNCVYLEIGRWVGCGRAGIVGP